MVPAVPRRAYECVDDARPHKAAAMVTFGWERLDHVPYSPDLAPSDFHFFPTLKRTLEERRFTNEDVEAVVRTQDTDFYQQGFFKFAKRWNKCINVDGDMLRNSRLMPCSAHIGVYLVHADSCRWRIRENYFPTNPRNTFMSCTGVLCPTDGLKERQYTSGYRQIGSHY
jgi:hypothetical protein